MSLSEGYIAHLPACIGGFFTILQADNADLARDVHLVARHQCVTLWIGDAVLSPKVAHFVPLSRCQYHERAADLEFRAGIQASSGCVRQSCTTKKFVVRMDWSQACFQAYPALWTVLFGPRVQPVVARNEIPLDSG